MHPFKRRGRGRGLISVWRGLPVLLLGTLFLLSPVEAMELEEAVVTSARILRVGNGPEADYPGLPEAIQAAKDGDTLQIISDIRTQEEVIIDKNLTLIGKETKWEKVRTNPPLSPRNRSLFRVKANKKVTVGDGQADHNITFALHQEEGVGVDGELTVREGAIFLGRAADGSRMSDDYPVVAVGNGGIYRGEGGRFDDVGLKIFTGGTGEIHGGSYYLEGNGTKICHPVDVFLGRITEITGGDFFCPKGAAIRVQGTVDLISGGTIRSNKPDVGALNVQYESEVGSIRGGTFTNPYGYGMSVFSSAPDCPRIRSISGGKFTGRQGIWLRSIDPSPVEGKAVVHVEEISGGIFEGEVTGIHVDLYSRIDRIIGGQVKGKNGIRNDSQIGEIRGGRFEATGSRGAALMNFSPKARVERISGGYFIGEANALLNRPQTQIAEITGGVFYGKKGYAFENLSEETTKLEPGLTAEIGKARYWGGRDVIDDPQQKVLYPDAYHMSSLTTTLPVVKIPETEFRYLKKFFTLNYDANGGTGVMAPQTETVDGEELILQENAFQKTGATFAGWNRMADGSGERLKPGEKLRLKGNTTLYAEWSSPAPVPPSPRPNPQPDPIPPWTPEKKPNPKPSAPTGKKDNVPHTGAAAPLVIFCE